MTCETEIYARPWTTGAHHVDTPAEGRKSVRVVQIAADDPYVLLTAKDLRRMLNEIAPGSLRHTY